MLRLGEPQSFARNSSKTIQIGLCCPQLTPKPRNVSLFVFVENVVHPARIPGGGGGGFELFSHEYLWLFKKSEKIPAPKIANRRGAHSIRRFEPGCPRGPITHHTRKTSQWLSIAAFSMVIGLDFRCISTQSVSWWLVILSRIWAEIAQ